MESIERIVSADGLTRLFLILLYASVILVSYRWLFPRFTPTCARIAGGFLAAQALMIVLALEHRPSTNPAWWLWDLNREYNIASALASAQLALVGGAALMSAGLNRAAPNWRRVYLLALAVVFLILAWDEYYTLHEEMQHWKRYYAAVGLTLAASTIAVALRSPRRARIWHVCLIAGLALSGAGAIFLEEFPLICGDLGFARLDGCLEFDVWEEGLELLGVWLALAAMLGGISDLASSAKPRIQLLLYALPVLWMLPLFIYANIPQLERLLLAKPAAVDFETGLRLHGYHVDSGAEATRIRLYTSAKRGIYEGIGYSVQLVDQLSGETLVSKDEQAGPLPGFWMLEPGDAPLYRQSLDLALPQATWSNRALWITLAIWREQDGQRRRLGIKNSDLELLSETQVILQELVLPGPALAFAAQPLAKFEYGFALAPVRLPERATPGETLRIDFAWRAEEGGREDVLQFLRLEHQDSGASWDYEQAPLGPRLPTRLWYSGLADSETWEIPLPADLAPGRYQLYTGLYRRGNLERVGASDANGIPLDDALVPLGTISVESR